MSGDAGKLSEHFPVRASLFSYINSNQGCGPSFLCADPNSDFKIRSDPDCDPF